MRAVAGPQSPLPIQADHGGVALKGMVVQWARLLSLGAATAKHRQGDCARKHERGVGAHLASAVRLFPQAEEKKERGRRLLLNGAFVVDCCRSRRPRTDGGGLTCFSQRRLQCIAQNAGRRQTTGKRAKGAGGLTIAAAGADG